MRQAIDIAVDRELPKVTRDLVVTFAYSSWDDACAREMRFAQDRLTSALIGAPRTGRLLVANPYRSVVGHLGRGLLGRRSAFPDDERTREHRPVRLRRDDPVAVSALRRSYRRYGLLLKRAAERTGMRRPAIITTHPLIAGFAQLDWAGPLTFYCTDDWTDYYGRRDWIPAFRQAYAEIRDARTRVCAVSDTIVERIDPLGPAIVVPNGIDPAEWADPDPPPPTWMDSMPAPRVVYIGTLDRRIDTGLVRETARAFPDGSVVLVGPLREPAHLAPLSGQGNVHVRPPISRAELPGLLAAADACVIPHAETQLTRAMSPLKMYEYLAAGRPVAAVDLPPLRNVDRRVVLAGGGTSFPEAVRRAVALGPATEPERREFVARNRWPNRHAAILEFALAPD